MGDKRGQAKGVWRGIFREALSAILVLALLTPSLAAKARRGAEIIVNKNDGTIVRGELLAVKGTQLLIMDGLAGGGISVSLADAKLVKVVNPAGFAIGFLAVVGGGVAGGFIGHAAGTHSKNTIAGPAIGTALGAGIGAGAGLIVGLVAGSGKKLKIAGTDSDSVEKAAARLRPLARDRS